ncbi:MAG: hypothetical protein ACI9UK_001476 [Candidatus Krumholzibacteriia bacterium]|jgi:hypothetical protein
MTHNFWPALPSPNWHEAARSHPHIVIRVACRLLLPDKDEKVKRIEKMHGVAKMIMAHPRLLEYKFINPSLAIIKKVIELLLSHESVRKLYIH